MSPLRGKITNINVKLYPGEPYLFANEPHGPVIIELDRRMRRAEIEAERRVRVRSGRLLATIHRETVRVRKWPAVDVVAGRARMNYLMFEHDGTVPHIIRARRKKSLRFMSAGKVVFRKSVRHPGTKGTFFLTRSLTSASGF